MTISIASGNLSIVSRGRFNAITIYKATKRRSQWRLPPLFVPLFSQPDTIGPFHRKRGQRLRMEEAVTKFIADPVGKSFHECGEN